MKPKLILSFPPRKLSPVRFRVVVGQVSVKRVVDLHNRPYSSLYAATLLTKRSH